MSDQLAYDVAADLTDFLSSAVDEIALPAGCGTPDRIFTAAGRPRVWPGCAELQVWISEIGATDIPNRSTGLDQAVCAQATFVEVNWRITHCITVAKEGKDPTDTGTHEAEAACFYSLTWGLYRRVMHNMGSIFADIPHCSNARSSSGLVTGPRSGGMVWATQAIRVQVELLDPATDNESS